jgi:hypothetical protein
MQKPCRKPQTKTPYPNSHLIYKANLRYERLLV